MSNKIVRTTAFLSAVFGLFCFLSVAVPPQLASDLQSETGEKSAVEKEHPTKVDGKTGADKEKLSSDKKKPQTERERRLESLAKSVEKEDRPALPTFSGSRRPKGNSSITFDDIKFEMKKGQRFDRKMLTDPIEALVGERLTLKGYIRPSIRQKDLTKFIFVRDDKECCFGPGAALYDCVLVTLAKGKKKDYTVRPITIEGDFFLKEFTGPDGRVWAVYRMKNGQVK